MASLLTSAALSGVWSADAQPSRAPSTLLPLEERWNTTLPGAPIAPPVIDGDRVFVALREGGLVAVGLTDGAVIWDIRQPEGLRLAGGDGLLFLETRDILRCLDAATGVERWTFPLDSPLSAPLVWNAGWLIAPLETGVLLVLRADTGQPLWRQSFEGGIVVPPALAGDRMYVSLDNGELFALALLSGEVLWQRRLPGAVQEVLPLDDLFVGATDNYFYSLSRTDGTMNWRWRAGGDIIGRPAVDRRRVFFTSLDNMLWALNRSNGVQQWRRPLAARPMAGPRRADDLLMQGGTAQQVSFFDPADGELYGRVSLLDELAFEPLSTRDPATHATLVITVSGGGQLQALGRATGPARLEPATASLFAVPPDNDEEAGLEGSIPVLP